MKTLTELKINLLVYTEANSDDVQKPYLTYLNYLFEKLDALSLGNSQLRKMCLTFCESAYWGLTKDKKAKKWWKDLSSKLEKVRKRPPTYMDIKLVDLLSKLGANLYDLHYTFVKEKVPKSIRTRIFRDSMTEILKLTINGNAFTERESLIVFAIFDQDCQSYNYDNALKKLTEDKVENLVSDCFPKLNYHLPNARKHLDYKLRVNTEINSNLKVIPLKVPEKIRQAIKDWDIGFFIREVTNLKNKVKSETWIKLNQDVRFIFDLPINWFLLEYDEATIFMSYWILGDPTNKIKKGKNKGLYQRIEPLNIGQNFFLSDKFYKTSFEDRFRKIKLADTLTNLASGLPIYQPSKKYTRIAVNKLYSYIQNNKNQVTFKVPDDKKSANDFELSQKIDSRNVDMGYIGVGEHPEMYLDEIPKTINYMTTAVLRITSSYYLRGTLSIINYPKINLNVEKVIMRFRENYTFTDTDRQPLGLWAKNPKIEINKARNFELVAKWKWEHGESLPQSIINEHIRKYNSVWIDHNTFLKFRDKIKKGGDYIILSDIFERKLNKPISINFEMKE